MKRFVMLGRVVLGLAVALALVALFTTAASAHTGNITIGCTSVTFSYSDFPTGSNLIDNETVSIDGVQVASQSFSFTGPSATDTVSISGQSGQTVDASANWTEDGGGSASATQTLSCGPTPSPSPSATPTPAPTPTPSSCPSGTKANFRWHYAANGSSGSWSGTKSVTCPGSLSIGPQAMEGDLRVSPGDTLKVGYDFTVPGNKASFSLNVGNPQVVFTVRCVSGASPSQGTVTASMPSQTYSVTNDQWIPSGDQSSPLVYQGSITVPDLCGGGQLRLDQGGTFTANVS